MCVCVCTIGFSVVFIYIYIYACVCVCVCECERERERVCVSVRVCTVEFSVVFMNMYIYIYIYFHILDREKVFADIEVLYSQLRKLKPRSDLASSDFKAKLNSLAPLFSAMSVAFDESRWGDQHRRVIKSLRNDNNLVISKGAGVVLLGHDDYVNKMLLILNDNTKFIKLGPVEVCDHTTSTEVKFQKQLRKWVKSGLLSPETSDSIRPVGSIRSRLYGQPKIHKDGVPLRPILLVLPNKKSPVGFHLCLNQFWSTLVVSSLKILFFF